MMTLEILPPPNLAAIAAKLAKIPGAMERAGRSAVRRTMKGGRQDAARKIAQRYTIRTGLVISTIRTRLSGMVGEMKSSGSRHPMEKFQIRPKRRPRIMPAGGVHALIVRGQGGMLPHAFLQRNGGVYERVSASRFPLRRLYSPSSPGMLAVPPVSSYIVTKMEERLGINLEHEARAVLGGFL